jgi:hypothetical protein
MGTNKTLNIPHLAKEVISESPRLDGLLCSYYLKTILFWIIEEIDECKWSVTTQTILIAYLRGKYLHQVEQLTGIASHSYIPDLWEYLPPTEYKKSQIYKGLAR